MRYILVALVLTGCSLFNSDDIEEPDIDETNLQEIEIQTEPQMKPSCANRQVDFARQLQQRSKGFLRDYYRQRNPTALYFAWYALEDSNYVIESIKNCADKTNRHFYAVENIKAQNIELEQVIAINGRSEEYIRMGQIYLDQYNQIFPRDIR